MCGTVDELSQTLLEEYWLKPQIIERLLRDPDLLQILKAQSAETNPEILRKQIESRWDQFPKQIYQAYSQEIEIQAERSLGLKRGEFTGKFKAMVRDFAERNGGESLLTRPLPEMAKDLTGLQRAYVAGDAEEFNSIVTRQLARMKELETPTGNWRGLKAELFYNRFAPFYLAMLLYLFALVLTIASWTGFGETFRRAALSVNGLALAVQIVGIILRIVISGRPPITNLYGSFLVIPAFGVILLMLVERFTRLGIGNLLASVTSFVSLLWAWTISIPDGDTFAVLVAVLDTQFWLSTHVICISFGYAATMVAGFLGMVWLVDSVLLKRMAPASQKTLSDLIYGITCFALLLSFFGTVLGGLWADDSWGRFWGWDPKENGALMIVLWNAAILHARWAGIARQHGIAAMAVLGCAVTIWSWEGVNQLGIGMHSYGFSEGRLFWVAVFALSVNLFAAASYLPRLLWGEQKSIAS
jgi:ABC-type transport system involved in cytochrome c biogenesis permease subunit